MVKIPRGGSQGVQAQQAVPPPSSNQGTKVYPQKTFQGNTLKEFLKETSRPMHPWERKVAFVGTIYLLGVLSGIILFLYLFPH